jgi:hypothetical protein
MSEINILNPTQNSPYNPDYGWDRQKPETLLRSRMASGKIYARRNGVQGRVWNFQWNGRTEAQAQYLEQWAAQYEFGYFSIYNFEAPLIGGFTKAYTVSFTGPLKVTIAGNQRYNISGQMEELAGKPRVNAQEDFATEGVFIEENDSEANPQVNLIGTWAITADDDTKYHGDYDNNGHRAYKSSTAADTAEWLYMGYGFQLWSPKGPSGGQFGLYVDDVLIGALNSFDVYSAAWVASASRYEIALPFGRHLVKIRVNHTKTGASAGFDVWADAIRVIP